MPGMPIIVAATRGIGAELPRNLVPQVCLQGHLYDQGLTQCKRFLCAWSHSFKPISLKGGPDLHIDS